MRCKKCNAVISSQTLNCPYCGQYNSQRKQKNEDFENQETVNTLNVVNMKKNYFSCFVGVLTVFCILCIGSIVIYSHFINGYTGTIEKQVKPIEVYREESHITLEQVLELSKKGENLSWEDFEQFSYYDTGKSGYQLLHYKIDETFELLVSGMWTNKPDGVELTLIADNTVKLDIRKLNTGEEDIQTFINKYSKN